MFACVAIFGVATIIFGLSENFYLSLAALVTLAAVYLVGSLTTLVQQLVAKRTRNREQHFDFAFRLDGSGGDDDALDHLGWLAALFGLRAVDGALGLELALRNVLPANEARAGGGHLHGQVAQQRLELVGPGDEVGLTVDFEQHSTLGARVAGFHGGQFQGLELIVNQAGTLPQQHVGTRLVLDVAAQVAVGCPQDLLPLVFQVLHDRQRA